jgi:hypothetical protein
MRPHPLHSLWPRRRFAWLLWLGLLLPVAQAAAMCHAVSHLRGAISGEADDKGAPHASHCDLCLTAASLAGGALIGTPSVFSPPRLRHQAPLASLASGWLAPPIRAYRSRAPPFASL